MFHNNNIIITIIIWSTERGRNRRKENILSITRMFIICTIQKILVYHSRERKRIERGGDCIAFSGDEKFI
jgi:hypothetical protein